MQPAERPVQDRPTAEAAKRLTRMGHRRMVLAWLGGSVALLGVLIHWASTSELEQIARARGQFIASARTQVVQAPSDGVIERVAVKEGEAVRKGQLLVQFDKAQAAAAVSDSRAKVAALRASLSRLQAEVLGRPLVFPAELRSHQSFIENQRELHQRRKAALDAEVAALEQSLSLVRQELSLVDGLVATGDLGRAELIRIQKMETEIQGQISSKRNRFFQDAQEAMTKAEEDLATQQQVLLDRSVALERLEVLSPADGLVRNIQITTPGARVRPGEVILEMLPTGSQLILEAKLKPADISMVRVGTPAIIKLDAYDYAIYGSLHGAVRYVSPDALMERGPQGEEAYYRVQVLLEQPGTPSSHAAPASRLDVQAGMLSTVEFVVGRHTVLQYISKPLVKTLSEALRER